MTCESPELAERAFYRAFEMGDVEGMMALWSPVGAVLCIHPMGPALTNLDAIRASWIEIFAAPHGAKISTELLSEQRANQVVVRAVVETFSIVGRSESFAPIFATNTFWQGDTGWYIASHHASPGKTLEVQETIGEVTRH
ncbi:MAG: nuclear transport factor 2 family protein [Pseudomonadota bacterium]